MLSDGDEVIRFRKFGMHFVSDHRAVHLFKILAASMRMSLVNCNALAFSERADSEYEYSSDLHDYFRAEIVMRIQYSLLTVSCPVDLIFL